MKKKYVQVDEWQWIRHKKIKMALKPKRAVGKAKFYCDSIEERRRPRPK